jgi:hypothetical protein
MFIAKNMWKLKLRIIDIETAFLRGYLKEETLMESPY